RSQPCPLTLTRVCSSIYLAAHSRELPSFPTRRSSDLEGRGPAPDLRPVLLVEGPGAGARPVGRPGSAAEPFGGTRRRHARRARRSEEHTLNSSHVKISYAVFCLKKKNRAVGA